ncbi:unnamed protein product [Effrenium voratum]|nr:unnamed protein product [Effrenium voratum]
MLGFLFRKSQQGQETYTALRASFSRDVPNPARTATVSRDRSKVCFDTEDVEGDHDPEIAHETSNVLRSTSLMRSSCHKLLTKRSMSINFNIASSPDADDGTDYDSVKESPLETYLSIRHLVIVPELSEDLKAKGHVHWVEVWDLSITVLIFFVAYYLPLILVLYQSSDQPASHRILECFVGIIFTCDDMFLQFFIAYSNPPNDLSKGPWQKDPLSIVKTNLGLGETFGWFWLDLASVVPFWLTALNGWHSSATVRIFGLLRVSKIFRMLNLPRLGRFMCRWQASFGFSYHVVDFCKFILIMSLTAHWCLSADSS